MSIMKNSKARQMLVLTVLAFAQFGGKVSSSPIELPIEASSCAIHFALTGLTAPSCPRPVPLGLSRSLVDRDPTKDAAPLSSDTANKGYFIRFAFNSDVLTGEYKNHLERLGKVLMSPQLAQSCVRLVGHTDGVGGANFNMILSRKRANSVRNYLTKTSGLAGIRVLAIGLGKTSPLPEVPSVHPLQRRVEIQARPSGNSPCS